MDREIARPRCLMLLTDVHANGGIQRFNRTLLAAMHTLGVDCDVLSMNDTDQSVGAQLAVPGIRLVHFSGSRWRFSLATLRKIWSHPYRWIFIGHVNLLVMASLAIRSRPMQRSRTYLIAHGIEVWYGINATRRWALVRLSSVLCVSNYTRTRICEQVPELKSSRIRVFPNALSDTWVEKQSVGGHPTRSRRYLLSVTRLQKGDRYKGIVTVIEALSMLEDRDLEYVVVGHGNDLAFLTLVAERYGVKDRVLFLNSVNDDDMVRLYENCMAFVLPSGKEGFGIVFLEAMYFGAPVIAAAEKGALDVIRDGETGLLVRFGDSIGVKSAIERVCGDRMLRERLCRQGRSTVTDGGPFTFSRFVERSAAVLNLRAEFPA